MFLYDGLSDIDWFYSGRMTSDQMSESDQYAILTEVPCVVYDVAGKAYRYETLESARSRWCVPDLGKPEKTFAALVAVQSARWPDPYAPAKEAMEKAEEAAGTANVALSTAEAASANANPQMVSLAKMQVATMSFESETEIASVSTLLPDWVPDGHAYKQGDAFQWGGRTWRVSQDTTSQSIYPPDVSESLYYEIVIADDGIIVYRQAHGQYDSVRLGEMRHYPDADGPVYKSLVDWNAYSPDTVPDNWELVSEE